MYSTGYELLELTKDKGVKISDIVIEKECKLSNLDESEIVKKMKINYEIMLSSSSLGLDKSLISISGITGGDSKKVNDYLNKNETICGSIINKAIARALSSSEVNASMGRICAAPTAGSCGIIPASIITSAEVLNSSEEDIVNALFTASGIGEIISKNATVSGAEGGCQAECGSAAAMAAAAIVELKKGSPEMSLNAAAIALKNIMGLICDPIAGLVEAPCAKRNASGAVNAMLSADMALAGVKSLIPFDEVVEAMYKVGKSLPVELRETALGGIAATKTGIEIKNKIFGEK